MNNTAALTVSQSPALSLTDTDKMILAGQVANQAAAGNIFMEHLQYKSTETKKAYQTAVSLFSDALAEININRSPDQLMTDPEAWRGVTWAMVKGYRDWLMDKGYATASVNQRLSIIRKMADLAGQAGVMGEEERLKIRGVSGYTSKTAKRADEQREEIRVSNQKNKSNFLDKRQVRDLLEGLPETPQGRRDQLMLAMLIYLGMRVSELTALKLGDFDFVGGLVHVYRQKTDTHSRLAMPWPLRDILRDYLEVRPSCAHDMLLVSSRKAKKGETPQLTASPMNKRAIQARVQLLGETILGIDNLSPHDMRHSLAETFAKKDISEAQAMDVLGWQTSAMFHHYRDKTRAVLVPDVW